MQLDEDRVGVESWHQEEGVGSLGRVGGGHRADRLLPQLCVHDNYRNNPFHNFRHCFCVAQMMYSMIWFCGLQVGWGRPSRRGAQGRSGGIPPGGELRAGLGGILPAGSLGWVWGTSHLEGSLGQQLLHHLEKHHPSSLSMNKWVPTPHPRERCVLPPPGHSWGRFIPLCHCPTPCQPAPHPPNPLSDPGEVFANGHPGPNDCGHLP